MSDDSMFDPSLIVNPMAWLAERYEILWQEMLWREIHGLDENNQPRNKGLKGIAGLGFILDEVQVPAVWFSNLPPWTFTPKEFEERWNSFPEDMKIEYVKSLMT